jgi:hypothetical protein
LISTTFEDVTVQKEPGMPEAGPVDGEQSLVTWSSPVRSEDADVDAAPVVMANATIIVKTLNFTDVSS